MKNIILPSIGLRTIKTAIVVFLCLTLLSNEPFFACIAGVICLQDTVSNSVKMGINRGMGTLVGACIGLIFMNLCKIINTIPLHITIIELLDHFTIALGVILVIYSCNLIKKPGAISVACIAFLGVTTTFAMNEPYFYAVHRTLETLCGIFIAILVNKFINPPN